MGNEVDLQRPFADVYKALDLKTQRKAMRSAMRKEGNRVKKVAVSTLHSKAIGPGTKRSLDKGIYVRTYPNRFGLGFMVTVKPFGKKGIHENRRSLEKPVLMWAEDGTRLRHVGKRTSSFFSKSRWSGNRCPDIGFWLRLRRRLRDLLKIIFLTVFNPTSKKQLRNKD